MERRELFLCPAEFCSAEREGGNAKVIFVHWSRKVKGRLCVHHTKCIRRTTEAMRR
jgi:hypothetical protein